MKCLEPNVYNDIITIAQGLIGKPSFQMILRTASLTFVTVSLNARMVGVWTRSGCAMGTMIAGTLATKTMIYAVSFIFGFFLLKGLRPISLLCSPQKCCACIQHSSQTPNFWANCVSRVWAVCHGQVFKNIKFKFWWLSHWVWVRVLVVTCVSLSKLIYYNCLFSPRGTCKGRGWYCFRKSHRSTTATQGCILPRELRNITGIILAQWRGH